MTGNPTQVYFRPGQFLFREGEPSSCMFLIKKGTVSVRKMKGAAFVEIARVYSNEVIGELSFFDRLPRSAAGVALTEVEALEIKFESLDRIYATVPDYLKTIISCIADRLRRADDTIKRLQKEVVKEADSTSGTKDEPSVSDVLALTAAVDSRGKPKSDSKESKKQAPGPKDSKNVGSESDAESESSEKPES